MRLEEGTRQWGMAWRGGGFVDPARSGYKGGYPRSFGVQRGGAGWGQRRGGGGGMGGAAADRGAEPAREQLLYEVGLRA